MAPTPASFQGIRGPEADWQVGTPKAQTGYFISYPICTPQLLSENKRLLSETSQEFRDIISIIQSNKAVTTCKDLARHTSFAMKRAAKMTHHASYEYNINTTMRPRSNSFVTSSSQTPASIGKPPSRTSSLVRHSRRRSETAL